MIAVELLIAILIIGVVLTGIVKVGAPLVDAFSERLKLKFQELEPEEQHQLKARIAFLEEEMRSTKQQLANLQESTDFAIRFLQESGHSNSDASRIHLAHEAKVVNK